MNDREFFNNLASKWDEISNHDESKIRKIIKLSKVKENYKILDVGTGTGVLVKYLLELSPEVVKAVDISENMIGVAKGKYDDQRVEFIVCDVMDFHEGNFDLIFLYSVYPHFVEKEKLFSHLQKLLKINGKIIIAHSESKEKINLAHRKRESVKDHILTAGNITAEIMGKYFKVEEVIDSEELYFVSGVKTYDTENR